MLELFLGTTSDWKSAPIAWKGGETYNIVNEMNEVLQSSWAEANNFTLAPGKYYIDVLDDVGTGSITVEPYTPPTTPPIKKEPVLVLPDLKICSTPL